MALNTEILLAGVEPVVSAPTLGWKPGQFGDWRKKGGTVVTKVICHCRGQGENQGIYLRWDKTLENVSTLF